MWDEEDDWDAYGPEEGWEDEADAVLDQQGNDWLALAAALRDPIDRLRLEMLVRRWGARHAAAERNPTPGALAAEALTLQQIGALLASRGLPAPARAALTRALPLARAAGAAAEVAKIDVALAALGGEPHE